MAEGCPLDYIKSVKCPGPIDMGRGRYICPRQDGHCQNRLNGRVFERSQQPIKEFDDRLERAAYPAFIREP